MPKLFKHLAGENEKKTGATKIMAETLKTFRGGDLFFGRFKKYVPLAENGEPLPEERKELVTTVNDRLAWNAKPIIEMLDHMATKDKANQKACADLVIGRVTIPGVPATCLLALEKRLREIRNIYDAAPTLDMSVQWARSSEHKDKYINGPIKTFRTAKVTKGVELSKATEKHAAQIEKVVEDQTIGTFETTTVSGALHPEQKARYLAKIDQLIETVKAARMDANLVETEKVEVGKAIFDFIHAD